MKSLATEYQQVVRGTQETDAAGTTARRSLDRKFQKLRPREAIDGIRTAGFRDVADRLDELFSASAMAFNLIAVSVGVDESEVLEIDIDGPHVAVVDALMLEE